ncbi:MAG TPA: DUF420 domain-containing protein [Thermoanaerobaculia bacterium]|nr:DUF420 domain-containing protein [Thermoanaerobaculia bacterium]
MDLALLPTVNALLNGASAVMLLLGLYFIRRRRWRAHRNAMLTAVALSVAFLTSYLIYHSQMGSTRFQGTGWIRPFYFSVLITHTVLAALVPIAAGLTLYQALRSRFGRHRAIARWTLPVWLYVSVTGVGIYWMLYRL